MSALGFFLRGFVVSTLGVLLCCLGLAAAQAFEPAENVKIHGFVTQGYFLTSDNRLFGHSDSRGGSLGFTEAALNASWMPLANARFAGQVLLRRAGSGQEDAIDLDFGLLDYTLFSSPDLLFGVRVGRLKNPFGLYNETRDVLFTRPTILLPQSIYPERTRTLTLSADAGLLYGEYRSALGSWFFDFAAGWPRANNLNTELAYFGADYPGVTDSELSYIGRVLYEREGGKYRVAVSSARVDVRYKVKYPLPDDLPSLNDIFTPIIFSAQYNEDQFSLTAEYAIRRIREKSDDGQFTLDVTGNSYYIQGLYRFDPKWQVILRYDALYNNRKDQSGKRYQALTGRPAYTQFAKDWTVGVRYHFNPSFQVAAEYHTIDGVAWLPIQDNLDMRTAERRWRMFSLAASYRF